MKSTCSYLRLKVTYFAFEDVGCIEVMGCVKKLSQTVPAGRDYRTRTRYCGYWESRIPRVPSGTDTVPVLEVEYCVELRCRPGYSIIVPVSRKSKTQIWDSWDSTDKARPRIRSLTANNAAGDSIWDLDPSILNVLGSQGGSGDPTPASEVEYEIRDPRDPASRVPT